MVMDMDVGNILSKSFKYPVKDFKNFLKICILWLLPIIPIVLIGLFEEEMTQTVLVGIFVILLLVFILVIPGYFISVVRQGCNVSYSMPSIKLGKNIINTLKLLVLNIIYSIIPISVFVGCFVASGIFSLSGNDLIGDFMALPDILSALATYMLIAFIVALIFSLISLVATARFAKHDSLAEAFSFKALFRDIKKIGILRIIGWYIVMNVVISFACSAAALIIFIPYAGAIIYLVFVIPYLITVFYYSLGLLYSNVGDSVELDEDDDEDFDLDEFEREIQAIKLMR